MMVGGMGCSSSGSVADAGCPVDDKDGGTFRITLTPWEDGPSPDGGTPYCGDAGAYEVTATVLRDGMLDLSGTPPFPAFDCASQGPIPGCQFNFVCSVVPLDAGNYRTNYRWILVMDGDDIADGGTIYNGCLYHVSGAFEPN
jgi:hypothetical protein